MRSVLWSVPELHRARRLNLKRVFQSFAVVAQIRQVFGKVQLRKHVGA